MTNYRFETQTEYDSLHAHRLTLASWHEGDKTEFGATKASRRVLAAALNIANHLVACALPPFPTDEVATPDEEAAEDAPADEPAAPPGAQDTSDGQADESHDPGIGATDGEADALDSYL